MPGGLEVRGVIARGAQGTVYLVHDRGLDRFLALKVFECVDDAAARAIADRLRRFASGDADPPVAILDLWLEGAAPAELREGLPPGSGGPRLLILMPLVPGPTLRELVEGDPDFGIVEAACALAQIAQRLRRLPAGLAHGDIKPENVLVDSEGRVFVIDPLAGQASGSPPYAAPEQGSGGEPRSPADVHALATLGLALLAGRFPRASDPPGFLPPLREPGPTATAEVRHAFAALSPRLAAGRHPDEGRRETMAELSKGLVEIAGTLAGADLAAPLAAAVARSRRPERLAVVAAEMERARGSTSPLALSSPLFDKAQHKLRGRIEGRARVPLYVAAAILLATLGVCYLLFLRPPAYANPEPASIHVLGSTASCRVFPPGQLLIPPAEGPDGSAVLVETIDEPVERVSVSILYGAEVLRMEAPRPEDSCSVVLPPGTYHRSVYYGHDKSFEDTLVLRVGRPTHDRTYPHGNLAPVDPHQEAERLANPAFGPLPLLQGPIWVDDVKWDPAQGALAVAEVWSDCKKQLRELIYQPTGRGPNDPREHLGRGEQLCAYAKPEAKNGFEVHYSYTTDDAPP